MPSGSKIKIILTYSTFQFTSFFPQIAFHDGNTSDAVSYIYTDPYILVTGGFGTDLGAGGSIRFTLSQIVNPYEQGNTSHFQVIIYEEADKYISFVSFNDSSMTININDIIL